MVICLVLVSRSTEGSFIKAKWKVSLIQTINQTHRLGKSIMTSHIGIPTNLVKRKETRDTVYAKFASLTMVCRKDTITPFNSPLCILILKQLL